jgi:uncharacterized protein YbjT (DUF2867 family)
MSKTILISGPTGNVASRLIPLLVADKGVHVRALVRNPAKAEKLAASGVQLVEGNFDHPRSLGKAFEGVDVLMSIVPNGPRAPQQASSLTWAARQAGVKHIVRLSAVGAAHDAPTVNSRLHALSDTELALSTVPFTVLKPHYFMQNLASTFESAQKDGVIYNPMGEGKLGMIDVADIAAVAARILLDPTPHAGKTYNPTGPKSISLHDVAAAYSAALGKPVKYVPVPFSAAEEGMKKWGLDEYMLGMMQDYTVAYARNWGDFANDDVLRITGKAPRSIEDFARDVFGKK